MNTRIQMFSLGYLLLVLSILTNAQQRHLADSSQLLTTNVPVSASCTGLNCTAETTAFFSQTVLCPVNAGQNCTFYIHPELQIDLSAKDAGYFRFLVDGSAPSQGVTDSLGLINWTSLDPYSSRLNTRSYAVVGSVTNSFANEEHTVTVNIRCKAETMVGCSTSAAGSLEIAVYRP